MLNKLIWKNKKAQVADTLTWVVATLIILVVLFIFVYAATLFAKTKTIEHSSKVLFLDSNGVGINWIDIKTSIAHKVNSNDKTTIDSWINKNET